MKFSKLIIACFCLIQFSCSTDALNPINEQEIEVSDLVGVWNLTDLRLAEGFNTPSLNLAAEIVDELVKQNCFSVTFVFNADGSASTQDRVDFIEINPTLTRLEVPCPQGSDSETIIWSLEGDQLTISNESQEVETITIQLEDDTLIISGEVINEENYSGAEAIFTRL